MNYITHPLIRPNSLEERKYQLSIAIRALDGNTMVVLPTGLGKTAIALLTAASRMNNTGGKILMLAPTKPLVEQHYRFFQKFLLEPADSGVHGSGFAMFTGETSIEDRTHAWGASRIIFATPQVIKNDCLAGRYGLEDVALLIVDECHRTVGQYAYVFIAHHYLKTANSPLLLAMTASPGSDKQKVEEVCTHLGIHTVETRVEEDEDVRPYIHEREVQYITVSLPPPLVEAVDILNSLMDERLEKLAKAGYAAPKSGSVSMKMLNALNASIQTRIQKRDPSAYMAASLYAECLKLRHALTLAETQGSEALKGYLHKLLAEGERSEATKASKRLAHDPQLHRLRDMSSRWEGELHTKLDHILNLVRIQLGSFPESRIIVFASYRDTVQLIVDYLESHGIESARFVGQATRDAEKGLTQKMQIETLRRFRDGEVKVLIATSVGEEGLDVPSTDLVIFHEAVPSEIRSIQRKGRTGRHGTGRIAVLVTGGTSDEAFRYVSQSRERAMVKGIQALSGRPQKEVSPKLIQSSIEAFIPEGPPITADDRETSSRVVEHLHSLGVKLSIERLEYGDYAIGSRIVVERKTTRDFMDTLVNRDLLGQMGEIARAAPRPVLIIEGEDLFSARNIHPNAVRGALVSMAIDMGVALFFARDAVETAEILAILARREGGARPERSPHAQKSYTSIRMQQEYIISAFPGIGMKHARLLLERFGSIHGVINAEEEELREVPGIGKKTAGMIWDVSHRRYQS
jgi:ERCC4-related helicase